MYTLTGILIMEAGNAGSDRGVVLSVVVFLKLVQELNMIVIKLPKNQPVDFIDYLLDRMNQISLFKRNCQVSPMRKFDQICIVANIVIKTSNDDSRKISL
jgi:hypothetical protein